MNCASCNTRIPRSVTHCFLCGAAQPGGGSVGAAASLLSGGSGSQSASSYARWIASSYPRSEGWRIWTSFFLGGLYAPWAASYLIEREEWTAGLKQSPLPPRPPSQRGGVVLILSLGLPLLLIAVLGMVVSSFNVRPASSDAAVEWLNLRAAYVFLWWNLLVASFFLISCVRARAVEKRFRALLHELSHGDPRSLDAFSQERISTWVAYFFSVLPLATLLTSAVQLQLHGWQSVQPLYALAYLLLLCAASWCTSWLNLRPAMRFRNTLFRSP